MKNTLRTTLLAAAVIAAISPAVFAQKPGAAGATMTQSEPGKRTDMNVITITATVEAIDKDARSVVLKGPEGKSVAVTLGPEAKNFDKIKVGDKVNVKYVEALSLELKKGGKAVVGRTENAAAAKAKPGENPAAAAGREIKVTADVTAVNASTQTVTLKGPQRTVDLKVNNPDQFKLIKVGDQVEATYTEAFAIALDPVPAPAAPAAPKK